ncbi:SDR family NAD(P)-dependent oxidoreductase, partial [Streptomyces sp. PRKS01-65]
HHNPTHHLLTALAHLHTTEPTGPNIWHHHYTRIHPTPRHVDLPTYPFQHRRYWVQTSARAGDVSAAGLQRPDHPLLGAVMELADGDGIVLTGRLSLSSHPWLADYSVGGVVLVPGTALLELAFQAGLRAGCPRVDELTLHAPLVVPEVGHVVVQVSVSAPDEAGRRAVNVYGRPAEAEETDGEWTRHAEGVLGPSADDGPDAEAAVAGEWPPPGAQPVDLDDLYGRLAGGGFVYGPVFQGLCAAWRVGDEVVAEVRLPDEGLADVAGFGVHPALLDAAVQTVTLLLPEDQEAGLVPHTWNGVSLHARGATVLRLRMTPTDATATTVRLDATDETGTPVLTLDSLLLRPVPLEGLGAGVRRGALFELGWVPVEETPTGASGGGELVVWECPGGGVAEATGAALGVVQDWLAEERAQDARLVVVTRGAVAVEVDEPVRDMAGAAVWGLVRSAQSEHPDRFVLLDLDPHTDTNTEPGPDPDSQPGPASGHGPEPASGHGPASDTGLESSHCPASGQGSGSGSRSGSGFGSGVGAGLDVGTGAGIDDAAVASAVARGESQLALRGGTVRAPRLKRVPAPPKSPDAVPFAPEGTVLVTGGTGTLGAAVACHLAAEYGVGHLLLVSRRGMAAPGAAQLCARLGEWGVSVSVVACDVADRAQVAALLEQVPGEHPLTAVVHTAGVLDDATVTGLDRDRVDTVLGAKVDGALHLHELTAHLDLSAFVLFSSAAGILGSPGQGNYAAANAALDALAHQRHVAGLPALSLAWGLWEEASGMTGHLDTGDRQRITRSGLHPLTTPDALALLDAALTTGRPAL